MKISSSTINQIFEDFNKLEVLVIGDAMLDAYQWGKITKNSPEAPVPIVAVDKQESRLGGAANVALNIQAMGATPILCSIIGNDADGDEFMELLNARKQSSEGILRVDNRKTTKKSRVIGNNHQMLRIDSEQMDPISTDLSNQFYQQIKGLIDGQRINCVIFEDYDKGVITPDLIQMVVKLCEEKNIPTTVDPKKRNFIDYQNVSLFKPNLKELREGLKVDVDPKNHAELQSAIDKLEDKLGNSITLITLSESGIYINSPYNCIGRSRPNADFASFGCKCLKAIK